MRHARRIVITVIGATVVAVGLALLVLPGPAFVVLPAGLALLGLEFEWARRLLRRVREQVDAATSSADCGGLPHSEAKRDDSGTSGRS